MIFDRERFRRELVRRLTGHAETPLGFLLDALVRDVLEVLDEQLEQPVTGPTHTPATLVILPEQYALTDGITVTCDGHDLTARPWWRG